MKPAIYFDLETGGVMPTHPNIQLAAVAVDEDTWHEISSIEMKIMFDERRADPDALAMNHYTAEAWKDAAVPWEACKRFAAFLDRFKSLEMVSKRTGNPYTVAKLVGHNAASFDGPRLFTMFRECDVFLPADPRVRCTCQRAMWYFDETGAVPPKDLKLATLCEYFGVPVVESHEALADVRLTVQLARAMREKFRVAA